MGIAELAQADLSGIQGYFVGFQYPSGSILASGSATWST